MIRYEVLDRKIVRCFYEEVEVDDGISTKEQKVILVLPTDDKSGLPDDIRTVCEAIHTDEVIAEYIATTDQAGPL